MSSGALLTVPNLLSLSRVGLALAFVVVDQVPARLALIAVAAATDLLDGWWARRSGVTTRLGALLDPIGDRFFALAAISTLLVDGYLTALQYFVLLARDLMTAIGFLVARAVSWLRTVTFRARFAGKVVTALQFVALLVALARPGWLAPVVVAVGVFSLAAIVDYTLALWRARDGAAEPAS